MSPTTMCKNKKILLTCKAIEIVNTFLVIITEIKIKRSIFVSESAKDEILVMVRRQLKSIKKQSIDSNF